MRKITISQRLEMNEIEHGIIGVGTIKYHYTVEEKKHKIIISIGGMEIVHKGLKAKQIWNKVISDGHKETINLIKRLACRACNIPLIKLKEKSRKKEIVFARGMVYWYLRTYMSYSLADAGLMFEQDHATVIHSIKIYDTLDKYQTSDRLEWKRSWHSLLGKYELWKKQA